MTYMTPTISLIGLASSAILGNSGAPVLDSPCTKLGIVPDTCIQLEAEW